MPVAYQACYPLVVSTLVPDTAGVEGSVPLIQPHGFDIRRVIKAKFHIASKFPDKLANPCWPTCPGTSSRVGQPVRRFFGLDNFLFKSRLVEIETTSWHFFCWVGNRLAKWNLQTTQPDPTNELWHVIFYKLFMMLYVTPNVSFFHMFKSLYLQ